MVSYIDITGGIRLKIATDAGARMNNTQAIKAAILKLLSQSESPLSAQEIISQLARSGFDAWEIREVIWDLTADSQARFTWDWKLEKLAPLIQPPAVTS